MSRAKKMARYPSNSRKQVKDYIPAEKKHIVTTALRVLLGLSLFAMSGDSDERFFFEVHRSIKCEQNY